MARVVHYHTGKILPGTPSRGLIEASTEGRSAEYDPDFCPNPTGAVGAYLKGGVWYYAPEGSCLVERIVYVEE